MRHAARVAVVALLVILSHGTAALAQDAEGAPAPAESDAGSQPEEHADAGAEGGDVPADAGEEETDGEAEPGSAGAAPGEGPTDVEALPDAEAQASAAVAAEVAQVEDEDLVAALKAWQRALRHKPELVSLATLGDLSQAREDLAAMLKERLKLLGRKKVSNRQWLDYWSDQQQTATRLAEVYEEHASAGDEEAARRSMGLREWALVAQDKVENQDRYLDAIETERDALEERLEAILMLETGDERPVSEPGTEEPLPLVDEAGQERTPYEIRERRLAELRRRLAHQEARRREAEVELKLVERQMETQTIMEEALEKDVQLAHRERAVAARHAEADDAEWSVIWRPIARATAKKVEALELELSLGRQRARDLEVEKSLLESQIAYRAEKREQIEARLEEVGSVAGWAEVVWETSIEWLKTQGWKVLLLLLIIWLGLKLALRLVNMGTAALLRAVEDDDPDSVSAEEARAHTIAAVFKGVARIAIVAIAILLAMEQVGINTGPILGSVAILGLAISFGSQNLVRDVVNGFFILIENQYTVGNVVEVSGVTGVVEEINIRSTRIRTLNGTLHVIPNGQISQVANLTRDWSRLLVHVGVSYSSDIDRCAEIIDRVGHEMVEDPAWQNKLQEAPLCLGVTSLGDSSIVLRVMAQVRPGEQWGAEREFNRRIKMAFDAAGIEIPFPQRVVWHRHEEDETEKPEGPLGSGGGSQRPGTRPSHARSGHAKSEAESEEDEAKREDIPADE